MPADVWLGIDVGTSGCRAIVIDEHGQIVVSGKTGFARPDLSEIDPYGQWRHVSDMLKTLLQGLGPYTLRAIAVDATSGSVMLCDADGAPLSPLLMYHDTRARAQVGRIAGVAPAESAAHGSGSGLAKMLWLLEQPRPVHAAMLVHQADWIAHRLGAAVGISDENNALKSGYDPVARRWPDWIDRLCPHQMLPRVVEPGTPTGWLHPRLAREWRLADRPRLVAGSTDSVAAFLATGAREPGEAVTSLGSTLVLKLIASRPVFCSQRGVYSHRIGKRWLAGGASNSGGAVLSQFFSHSQLAALSTQIDPDAVPPDYYPLPATGERFPVNDPNRRPRITPRPHSDATFLHGLLHGIARIEAQGYAVLEQLGAPALRSVRTVGGGADNAVWKQIRQRLLSVPLLDPLHSEAAYGSALLARDRTAVLG